MVFFPMVNERSLTPVYSIEQIADAAFEFFSANGFPYHRLTKHVCMQQINKLRKTDGSALLRSNVAMRVADTYHPHRFHAISFGRKPPVENMRDEKKLRIAIALRLKYFGEIGTGYFSELGLVRGTGSCSNYRPAFALYVYRKYCEPGGTVLDTCFGFGGRLVGFLASDCQKYIGFDPSTKSYEGNRGLAADLVRGEKEVLLRCLPIEDANPIEFKGTVDLAFTSPPYFCREVYSEEETQSCHRYKTARDWCNGFLVPMMRFQIRCLKVGGFALVNIADVKIGNKSFPLVKWTIRAAERSGFTYKDQFPYSLTRRFGPKKKAVSMEPVLVFRKEGEITEVLR